MVTWQQTTSFLGRQHNTLQRGAQLTYSAVARCKPLGHYTHALSLHLLKVVNLAVSVTSHCLCVGYCERALTVNSQFLGDCACDPSRMPTVRNPIG